jgi:membrane-bound lytic murein transglycosylase B
MVEHRATLEAIERRYGVDPAVVVAIWGIESNFGRGTGSFAVLRSLATLGCHGRRQTYFRRGGASSPRTAPGSVM